MNLTEPNLPNIGERRPTRRWTEVRNVGIQLENTYAQSTWVSGRFVVISELCVANMPDGTIGPQWTVSISRKGRRIANRKECLRMLSAFGMQFAEENNHEPGRVRKFWMPLEVAKRNLECPCKEDIVVESNGYRYSRGKSKARWVDVDEPQGAFDLAPAFDGDHPALAAGGVTPTPRSTVVAGGVSRRNGTRIGG